ncbi:MAG TPA: hypothetical protein VIV15_17470 [Anaerolineales bacterium]
MMAKIATAIFLLLTFSLPCHAEEAGRTTDEPYRVVLLTGETFKVCLSGQIVCPAISPICDDLNVAAPVETPEGLGFAAVGPGSTLCSAANPSGQRRVFRIDVRRPD